MITYIDEFGQINRSKYGKEIPDGCKLAVLDEKDNPYTHYLPSGEPDFVKINSEARTVFEFEFRSERNAELAKADIEINKAEDLGEDTTILRKYRQDLRDATKTWIMPTKG